MNTAEFSIMPHLGIVFLLLQLYPEFGSREPTPHIIAFVYLHQFYPRYLEAFRKKLELENQKPSKQKEIIKQRRETRVQLSYDYHLLVALFLLWFLSVLNCRHWAVTLIFLLYLLWVLADLEILRWLNYGTEMLWPKMEEYASKKVFQPIVDWFLEKHKPSTLKKARVQWLSLGSNPPSITDFHSFRNSDSNWGLVIELGINFSADNHMKSTLATKPRDGSGSGKWVKLNMTELYVDGKVLIVVNFINHRPFVSCLQVCFVQPPYLKMTSKPVMTRELEVEKPPLIFRKLDNLCSVAVKEKLVWPSTLKLDMERYAATCTENTESCFFLDVKEPVAYVRVGDIKAFSLNPRWFPVDWYVEVRVGDRKWRSRAQRTRSPCWDEEYKIPVPTWLDKIMVKVCYEGILGGMIYGWSSFDMNDVKEGGSHSRRLSLRNNLRRFLPFSVAEDLHLSVTLLESNEDFHVPNEASSSANEDEVELAKTPPPPVVAEATSPTAPQVIENPPSPTSVTRSSLYAPTSGQELPTFDSTTSPVSPTILSEDANDTPRFPSSTSPDANQTATFKSTNPETSTVTLGDIVYSTLPTFAHSPSISPSTDCQISPFSVPPSKPVPTITGSTIELDSSKVSLPCPGELANVRKVLRDAVPTPTVTPSALVAEEVAALTAKEKCREFLKLSSGGFVTILSDSTFEAKVKILLTAFCDDLVFSKHPQFQNRCEEYLPKLTSGIETLKRNYNQPQSLASSERGNRAVASSLEKKRESTAQLCKSYEAMVQTEARLAKKVAILEDQLAEAKRQHISHKLHMTEMWHTPDVSTKKLDKVSKEPEDYVSNLDRQNILKPQLSAENLALDKELMSFRVVVEKLLATL